MTKQEFLSKVIMLGYKKNSASLYVKRNSFDMVIIYNDTAITKIDKVSKYHIDFDSALEQVIKNHT